METLGDALPKEIARVQEIIFEYERINLGFIAAAMMRADVERAQYAMMSGDLPGMIAAYQALKEYTL